MTIDADEMRRIWFGNFNARAEEIMATNQVPAYLAKHCRKK